MLLFQIMLLLKTLRLFIAAALVPCALCQAQDLRVVLEEVRELAKAQEWSTAAGKMAEVFSLAEDDPAAPLLWTEIVDLSERTAFWKDYSIPEPKDVVRGELVKWKPKTGDMTLRYEARDGGALPKQTPFGDFIQQKGVLLHPVLFQGSYRVELSGKRLAGPNLIYVEWRWDRADGTANGASYAVRFDDVSAIMTPVLGNFVVMDRKSSMMRLGRRFSMEVQVGSNAIQASMGGKRLFKFPREKGDYGQVALIQPLEAERVEISGEVDPAWIQGLIDRRIHKDYDSFCRKFKAERRLPKSLRSALSGKIQRQRGYWFVLPEPEAEENHSVLAKLKDFESGKGTERERLNQAFQYMQEVKASKLSKLAGQWVKGVIHLGKGQRDDALELIREVAKEAPEFFEARWLLFNLEYDQLTDVERGTRLRGLTEDFTNHADPWELLARVEMNLSGLQGCREVIGEAIGSGFPAKGLERIMYTVSRAEHGPAFHDPATVTTKNYIVVTDLGERTARRVGRLLEDVYGRYNTRVRRVTAKDVPPMRVCFFSGQAGYSDYCNDLLGDPAESSLGLFSPTLKQLLVWSNPDPSMTDRTIRHEGFHQYLDRLVGDSPIWLNEGLAESVEQARFVRGRWTTDHLNRDHLTVLRQQKWTRVRDLVRYTPTEFRTNSSLHYAQSWALVHFFENGPSSRKRILNTLLDELIDGATNAAAVESAFEGVDWDDFERDFRKYVTKLSK